MSHLHAKRFDIHDDCIMENAAAASNTALALWLFACKHSCASGFMDSSCIAALCTQGETQVMCLHVSLCFRFSM